MPAVGENERWRGRGDVEMGSVRRVEHHQIRNGGRGNGHDDRDSFASTSSASASNSVDAALSDEKREKRSADRRQRALKLNADPRYGKRDDVEKWIKFYVPISILAHEMRTRISQSTLKTDLIQFVVILLTLFVSIIFVLPVSHDEKFTASYGLEQRTSYGTRARYFTDQLDENFTVVRSEGPLVSSYNQINDWDTWRQYYWTQMLESFCQGLPSEQVYRCKWQILNTQIRSDEYNSCVDNDLSLLSGLSCQANTFESCYTSSKLQYVIDDPSAVLVSNRAQWETDNKARQFYGLDEADMEKNVRSPFCLDMYGAKNARSCVYKNDKKESFTVFVPENYAGDPFTTGAPTDPFATGTPTNAPTDSPTSNATEAPTHSPTSNATDAPTDTPTRNATDAPTDTPTSNASDAAESSTRAAGVYETVWESRKRCVTSQAKSNYLETHSVGNLVACKEYCDLDNDCIGIIKRNPGCSLMGVDSVCVPYTAKGSWTYYNRTGDVAEPTASPTSNPTDAPTDSQRRRSLDEATATLARKREYFNQQLQYIQKGGGDTFIDSSTRSMTTSMSYINENSGGVGMIIMRTDISYGGKFDIKIYSGYTNLDKIFPSNTEKVFIFFIALCLVYSLYQTAYKFIVRWRTALSSSWLFIDAAMAILYLILVINIAPVLWGGGSMRDMRRHLETNDYFPDCALEVGTRDSVKFTNLVGWVLTATIVKSLKYISLHPALKVVWRAITTLMSRIFYLSLLVLFSLTVYGAFAMLLFGHGSLYFSDTFKALTSLSLLMIGNEVNDIYFGLKDISNHVGIFFIVFMVDFYFLFQALVLATVVESYRKTIEGAKEQGLAKHEADRWKNHMFGSRKVRNTDWKGSVESPLSRIRRYFLSSIAWLGRAYATLKDYKTWFVKAKAAYIAWKLKRKAKAEYICDSTLLENLMKLKNRKGNKQKIFVSFNEIKRLSSSYSRAVVLGKDDETTGIEDTRVVELMVLCGDINLYDANEVAKVTTSWGNEIVRRGVEWEMPSDHDIAVHADRLPRKVRSARTAASSRSSGSGGKMRELHILLTEIIEDQSRSFQRLADHAEDMTDEAEKSLAMIDRMQANLRTSITSAGTLAQFPQND